MVANRKFPVIYDISEKSYKKNIENDDIYVATKYLTNNNLDFFFVIQKENIVFS